MPGARKSLRRFARAAAYGCLTLPLVAAVVAFVGSAAGAPPEHDVLTDGGRSIGYSAEFSSSAEIVGPIAPTTSLAKARCEAWHQHHSGDCPTATTLASMYWPKLQQVPQTVYVGVQAYCDPKSNHFNLELGKGARLILHCHYAARWVNLERPVMGQIALPITNLLVVSTSGWTPGEYVVVREDRVERWFSDSVTQKVLGVVDVTGES